MLPSDKPKKELRILKKKRTEKPGRAHSYTEKYDSPPHIQKAFKERLKPILDARYFINHASPTHSPRALKEEIDSFKQTITILKGTKDIIKKYKYSKYWNDFLKEMFQSLKKINRFNRLSVIGSSILQAVFAFSGLFCVLEVFDEQKTAGLRIGQSIFASIFVITKIFLNNLKQMHLYKIRKSTGFLFKNIYFYKLMRVNYIYLPIFDKLNLHHTVWKNAKRIERYYEIGAEGISFPVIILIYFGASIYIFGFLASLIGIGLFLLSESIFFLSEIKHGKKKNDNEKHTIWKLQIKKMILKEEFFEDYNAELDPSIKLNFVEKIGRVKQHERNIKINRLRLDSIIRSISQSIPILIPFLTNLTMQKLGFEPKSGIEVLALLFVYWEIEKTKWRYIGFLRTKKHNSTAISFFKTLYEEIEEKETKTGAGGYANRSDNADQYDIGNVELVNVDFGVLDYDNCHSKVKKMMLDETHLEKQGTKIISLHEDAIVKDSDNEIKTQKAESDAQNDEPVPKSERRSHFDTLNRVQEKTLPKKAAFHVVRKRIINSVHVPNSPRLSSIKKPYSHLPHPKILINASMTSQAHSSLRHSSLRLLNFGGTPSPSPLPPVIPTPFSPLYSNMLFLKDLRRGDRYKLRRCGKDIVTKLDTIKLLFKVKSCQKCALMGGENDGVHDILQGLVGNRYLVVGQRKIAGQIAYLRYDDEFLMEFKSIKDNILFGEGERPGRLNIIMSAINAEFLSYPKREETLVLKRGCNLEYEDRLKVMLARMLYKDSDIYLIENFFDLFRRSVAQSLIKRLFSGILSEKTVILSSNIDNIVKQTDIIYIFKLGTIVQFGSYNELSKARDINFCAVIENEIDFLRSESDLRAVARKRTNPYIAWKSEITSIKQRGKNIKMERDKLIDILIQESLLCKQDEIRLTRLNSATFGVTHEWTHFFSFLSSFGAKKIVTIGIFCILREASFLSCLWILYNNDSENLPLLDRSDSKGKIETMFIFLLLLLLYTGFNFAEEYLLGKGLIDFSDTLFSTSIQKLMEFKNYLTLRKNKSYMYLGLFDDHEKLDSRGNYFLFRSMKLGISISMIGIKLLTLYAPSSLLILVLILIATFITVFISRGLLKKTLFDFLDSKRKLQKTFYFALRNIKCIRTANQTILIEDEFCKDNDRYERNNYLLYSRYISGSQVIILVISVICTLYVLIAGIYKLDVSTTFFDGYGNDFFNSIAGILCLKLVWEFGQISTSLRFVQIYSPHLFNILRFQGSRRCMSMFECHFMSEMVYRSEGNSRDSLMLHSSDFDSFERGELLLKATPFSISLGGKEILKKMFFEFYKGERVAYVSKNNSNLFFMFYLLKYSNICNIKTGGEFKDYTDDEGSFSKHKRIYYLKSAPSLCRGSYIDIICQGLKGSHSLYRHRIIELMSQLRILEVLARINKDSKSIYELSKMDKKSRTTIFTLSLNAWKTIVKKPHYNNERKNLDKNSNCRDPRRSLIHIRFFKALISLYVKKVLIEDVDDIAAQENESGSMTSGLPCKIQPESNNKMHDYVRRKSSNQFLNLDRRKSNNVDIPEIGGGLSFYNTQVDEIALENEILSEYEIYDLLIQVKVKKGGFNIPKILKKVAMIIRAIISQPQLMLIEEPMLEIHGTDTEYVLSVLFQQLRFTTFAVALKNYQSSLKFSRIYCINEGSITEYGRPLDLYSNPKTVFHSLVKKDLSACRLFEREIAMRKKTSFNDTPRDNLSHSLTLNDMMMDQIVKMAATQRMEDRTKSQSGQRTDFINYPKTARDQIVPQGIRLQPKDLAEDSHLLEASRMN